MGIFYSSFLEKCILPLGESIFGISYTKHLKKLRKVVKFSERELINYQNSKLEEVLSNALKHSDFYKSFRKAVILGYSLSINKVFNSA